MNPSFITLAEAHADFAQNVEIPHSKVAFYSGAAAAIEMLIHGTDEQRAALCDEVNRFKAELIQPEHKSEALDRLRLTDLEGL